MEYSRKAYCVLLVYTSYVDIGERTGLRIAQWVEFESMD
jgi:hypothetical protein